MEYLQAHLRPVVLLLHHQVQIQPPLSQIPLVLILHLFKTDYQLNDIFPVEITMKNIEIIGRTGTIPFLEMKIQNSYTLEQAQTNNTIKGGCIMDIWHRVGRIVRFSNLGTLLFFTLNILLIVAVFGSSGSIVELICIYFFTVAISLSPLGEMCLAAFAGASDIKRVDIKLRVVPLVQYVLDKAKENTSYCPKKVKVKIIHDPAPNAFALGRQTLCITDGLLLLSDDMILGILAHEIGHLSYGHTVIQLLIGGGNIFISGCLLLIKISYWIFSAIMGLFAICSRSGVMGIITAVFAGISTALSWLWVKFCMLFLMWSMRQNEYLADEFAYKIGFGLELATVLDQHISDVPHDGFLSAIYSTHPCNDDRVAALQNLGVPYSRY